MPLYAYCIIPYEKGKNFTFLESGIYSLPYRDIAAVVSDCNQTEHKLEENAVREHEAVIRKVMAKHAVVPVAFGMAFENEEILQSVLEKAYLALKEHLAVLSNKIEVGLKVITTSAAKNLGFAKEEIENVLSTKAVEAVKGRLFSDRLLLNNSFLIEKNRLKEFSSTVAKLEKKYPHLHFQYSGPWPPYSFTNIKITAK